MPARKRFCIKHYYKNRGLKQLSQWLVIGVASIVFLGMFAVCDAYAAAPSCVDLDGATADLVPPGMNAGVINFTEAADPPNPAYKAVLCSTGGQDDFELKGWVWNNNLGYISLYCKDGKNQGVACGSIDYGVTMNITSGTMQGWAWGDNIGWISFMCKAGKNDDLGCGLINYSSKMENIVNKNLGTFSGHAWADTVGWFDFSGVQAKVLDLIMTEGGVEVSPGVWEETKWGVWTKGEIEDNDLENKYTENPNKKYLPVANGSSGYDLFVHIADIAGNPVVPAADVNVEIITQWQDTVHYDQTVSDNNEFNQANNGPVQKPSVLTHLGYELTYKPGEITTGGTADSYHGITTSLAPTDGGNCWDGDGDGSCYTGDNNYFYKNFGDNIEDQTLAYAGANVQITIIPTGEVWSTLINPLGGGMKIMDFLPAIDIETLSYLLTPGDLSSAANLIQATRNTADEFYIQGKVAPGFSDPYSIKLELEEDEPDVDYLFIPSLEADASVEGSAVKTYNNVLAIGPIELAIPFAPDSELAEQIGGAVIRSTITINGLVKYFNNGLPRTLDSVILNQQAQIVSGSVFSPGAKAVTTGAEVPLYGDSAVYQLRTRVLGDVSNLIRGKDEVGTGSDFTISAGMSQSVLSPYSLKDGRVYYFNNMDVHLESTDPLTDVITDKPISIIVDGGDLYVDDNINTGQAVGLITLESISDPNEDTKGGHIYIHSDVTDMVDVHIFSDGPMFRYSPGVCFYWGNDGTGAPALRVPNFVKAGMCSSAGSFQEPVSSLVNQFYLKGSVATLNCLGCSAGLEPTRGDGKKLGVPSAENYATARLYDFNYFSNYREDPLNPGSFPGVESAEVLANPAIDAAKKNYPVYFDYSPAPADLLGFRAY